MLYFNKIIYRCLKCLKCVVIIKTYQSRSVRPSPNLDKVTVSFDKLINTDIEDSQFFPVLISIALLSKLCYMFFLKWCTCPNESIIILSLIKIFSNFIPTPQSLDCIT